jgi:hypothetical protein
VDLGLLLLTLCVGYEVLCMHLAQVVKGSIILTRLGHVKDFMRPASSA